MNKVILIGRMTADAEAKTLQNETIVCNFTVAVDRKFKKDGQPTADFFNCVAFGKRAELLAKWFTKGKMIALEGSLQNRNWDDKEGKKHYATEVMVDSIHFCDNKSGENQSANNNTSTDNNAFANNGTPPFDEYTSDDELPF